MSRRILLRSEDDTVVPSETGDSDLESESRRDVPERLRERFDMALRCWADALGCDRST